MIPEMDQVESPLSESNGAGQIRKCRNTKK